MLQVIAGPMIQVLEEEIERNKKTLQELDQEKNQLLRTLEESKSDHNNLLVDV